MRDSPATIESGLAVILGNLGGNDANVYRLTLTEVRRAILEHHSLFMPTDNVPIPCHTKGTRDGIRR